MIRVAILFSSILVSTAFHVAKVEAPNGFPVHNLDTGLNYTTIQEAIDANETEAGHTIFVEEGTYFEHVTVGKSLILLGEDRDATIIDGNMTGNVVRITNDHVKISSFTIQRSGRASFNSGISISSTRHCDISANRIIDNEIGVHGSPVNTTISSNTITNNHVGVAIDPGATYNIITRNRLTANTVSIHVYYANSNNITKNNMTNNWRSITLGYSSDNRLYHNTFFNNTEPILILASDYTNIWDCGYPSGGNYWSNYTGVDADHDGIGDTEHTIDANNTDHYPLMGVFSDFNATSEHHVQTICNSTISDFAYNGTALSFNVTGEYATTGFCRICIPAALMSEYRIFVNGTEIVPSPDPLPCSNSTHSYLYFTYTHSTQDVIIIPEFPSLGILPLFMTVTLLAAIAYRKLRLSIRLQ